MKDPRIGVEPTLLPHTAGETAMDCVRHCLSHSLMSSELVCAHSTGQSRAGKSWLLEEAVRRMPRNPTTASGVVPILSVTVPERPTAKGIVLFLLQALGEPKWAWATQCALTGRLQTQLRERKTLMIVIDEIQKLN